MKLKRRAVPSAIAVAFVLGAASRAGALPPADEAAKPAIEPAALSALQAMGAYLRTLKSFHVTTKTTDEDVLDDGQKIQYDGAVSMVAELPGRLRAEVESDRRSRLYLYDGKTFTLFAKRINYYATVPAPETVGKLADALEEKYGLSVPLEDLFRWGQPGWSTDQITAAIDVGPSPVEGTTCEQYAFRQADIDWQVWIQKGAHPLPRKLVITTRTDEARPQHTDTYTWNLAPSYNEETFVFDPPDGAVRVLLGDALKAAR